MKWIALMLLVGCASDPCDALHPDTALLLGECKLRVVRECPTLKRGECKPLEPCPQCPAVEQCHAATRERCGL
jgi:hypothetical protein